MKSGEKIFRVKSYQLVELWLLQRLVYLSNIIHQFARWKL